MIHVVCNIDGNYVKYCAVTLVSLFENNKNESIQVHIIATGLTNKDENLLILLADKYNNIVKFYSPDKKMLEGFSICKFSKRISMATYYRCILSKVLPDSIDKILYLDCDIIVLSSIIPFWNTPLDNVGVAVIEDIGCNEEERYDILKYPAKDSYFNAGVMLINLKYWREHDMAEACVDYYHKYPERILFNDQDLLNSLLHDSKKFVDLRWNVQDGFYRNPKVLTEEWKNKFVDVLKKPVILHYTNRKPWDYDSQHPLREEFFKYLDLTPWKGERALNNPINCIRRFFRLFPFYVHIRRAKYINMSKI